MAENSQSVIVYAACTERVVGDSPIQPDISDQSNKAHFRKNSALCHVAVTLHVLVTCIVYHVEINGYIIAPP